MRHCVTSCAYPACRDLLYKILLFCFIQLGRFPKPFSAVTKNKTKLNNRLLGWVSFQGSFTVNIPRWWAVSDPHTGELVLMRLSVKGGLCCCGCFLLLFSFIFIESTCKGVNWCLENVTRVQQQRPELPRVTPTWHACKYKVYKLHQSYILSVLIE